MSISSQRGQVYFAISKYGQKQQKLEKSRENGLFWLIWASYQKNFDEKLRSHRFWSHSNQESQFLELFKIFRILL